MKHMKHMKCINPGTYDYHVSHDFAYEGYQEHDAFEACEPCKSCEECEALKS